MPRLVMFDGPVPPEPGTLWCTICAMLYKQAGVELYAETIEMANKSNGEMMRVDLEVVPAGKTDRRLYPSVAVARGIFSPMPQLGPVELCWSHLMGLSISSGLLPAGPQEMAQLGQSVPLIGQGR